jgi:hypothetical protein
MPFPRSLTHIRYLRLLQRTPLIQAKRYRSPRHTSNSRTARSAPAEDGKERRREAGAARILRPLRIVSHIDDVGGQEIGPRLSALDRESGAIDPGRRKRRLDARVFGLASDEIKISLLFDQNPSLSLRRRGLGLLKTTNFHHCNPVASGFTFCSSRQSPTRPASRIACTRSDMGGEAATIDPAAGWGDGATSRSVAYAHRTRCISWTNPTLRPAVCGTLLSPFCSCIADRLPGQRRSFSNSCYKRVLRRFL